MKKVKGMLAGIAVLAVVGGAFAFKAKSTYNSQVFYTFTTAHTTSCAALAQNFTTTTGAGALTEVYYTIALTSAPCITTAAFLSARN
jgi:hypothetical protein